MLHDELPVLRQRPEFARLQPAAPPESSSCEVVREIETLLPPEPVDCRNTQYVVLAARSMPPPDAVKVLSPALSDPESVNVCRLVPGVPLEFE